MARIVEEVIAVKFSKLVKDSDSDSNWVVEQAHIQDIETFVQQLVGDKITVELITTDTN